MSAYESAWMARWARMGSDAALQGHGCLSFKDDDLGCSKDLPVIRPKMALGDSASVERFRDVTECRRVDNAEEKIEERHWKEPGNERQDFLPFPMFNVSQQREASSRKRSLILGGESLVKDVLAASSSSQALVNKRPRMQSWMYTRKENALLRVDSDEGTRRGAPYRHSQTACHFLFTKKTNVNLPEDVQVHRESTDSMKLKGKMFSGFANLFPGLLLRHQGCVKPQPPGSSKDGERVEIVDEVENSAVRRNRLAGSTASSSTKVKGRENQSTLPMTGLPDMNQERPVVLDRESSMNVEHFLSNAELHAQCYRAKPEPKLESEPDSSRRWLKRLKMSTSDSSGHGTRNIKVEDSLCVENVNGFFLEIMKCRITDPEIRNQQRLPSETKNPNPQGEETVLRHPWVHRWYRNEATSHRPAEPDVSCEAVEIPKGTTSEEISKKQLPSIWSYCVDGEGSERL